MALRRKLISFDDVKSQYEAYIINGNLKDTAENFRKFLSLHKSFSSIHYKSLYNYYKTNELRPANIRMRKTSRRPSIAKKTSAYAAVSGGAFGALIGGLRAQTLVAGSKYLGFIPVTSSVAINTIPAVAIGLALGAGVTFAALKIKDAVVKAHYSRKYGTIKNNFIGKSSTLEELIDLTEKTNNEILDLKKKGGFFNWVKRTAKNVVNRNRIHHIMKCRKQLAEAYALTARDKTISEERRALLIMNHGERLDRINNFIINDIKNQKDFNKDKFIHSLLTGKKPPKIENIDIYGDSEIQVKRVLKSALGETDAMRRNYRNKVSEAKRVFGIGSEVENLLERLYARKVEEKVISDYVAPIEEPASTETTEPEPTAETLVVSAPDEKAPEVKDAVPSLEEPKNPSLNQGEVIYLPGKTEDNSTADDQSAVYTKKTSTKKSEDYISTYKIAKALLETPTYLTDLMHTPIYYDDKMVSNLIAKLSFAIENKKKINFKNKSSDIYKLFEYTCKVALENGDNVRVQVISVLND